MMLLSLARGQAALLRQEREALVAKTVDPKLTAERDEVKQKVAATEAEQ
jgi:hypothetical protein